MKKILLLILGICISYSAGFLSLFLLSLGHENSDYYLLKTTATFIVSFLTSFYIYIKNYKYIIEKYKSKLIIYFISILLSIILLLNFHHFYTINNYNSLYHLFDFSKVKTITMAFLGLLFYINIILIKLKDIFKIFISKLEPTDKKIFLGLSAFIICFITFLYNYNSCFFTQYDKVYSLDSGFVFNSIYKNFAYYDIRHPLLNIPTSIIFFILKSVLYFFTNSNTVLAILIQIINAELILTIGLILKVITKNKMIFYLYIVSLPSLLFIVFLEKYQLCVFFILLYIFLIHIKKNGNVIFSLSAGCMPTSSVVGICELLKQDKIKNKIINIIKIILTTLALIIILGKINVLLNGYDQIIMTRNRFTDLNISFKGRILSFLNFITSLIIALPSGIIKEKFLWNNLSTSFNYLSIIILLITIIGFIKNRKNYINKVFIGWLGFSFILFVIIKWSVIDCPLFGLYFSWALIPLFVQGIDFITTRFKINKKITYIVLLIVILIINAYTLININQFLLT